MRPTPNFRHAELLLPTLLSSLAFVACSGDNGGAGTEADTGEQETGGTDQGDAVDDSAEEVEIAEPDIADSVEEAGADTPAEVAEEVTDTAGSGDAVADLPTDLEPDTAVDTGTDCTGRPSLCDEPYRCINQVCRLYAGGTTWAENGFDIVEPEELTRAFDIIKGFASAVSFLTIQIEDGPDATVRPAVYGAADRVPRGDGTFDYRWQFPDALAPLTFRPHTPEEATLHGGAWISDEFTYVLVANVAFLDQVFEIGATAEQGQIVIDLLEGMERATGRMAGSLTRAEAETRFMGDETQFAPFAALACTDTSFTPPDHEWHLADVLDCNGAPLDVDLDGDGTNESYHMVIEANFVPATIIP